jgi:[ribosomal protein S5]-alanine N-acetyltransferase
MAVPLPIETARLTIRPFDVEADSAPMLAVYGDPEVMRYIPGGAVRDVDEVRALLELYAKTQETYGFSSWAVVERESQRVIGDAGFGVFAPTQDIELGYTLSRDSWGKGYASEAAQACLATGLRHVSAPRIIAVVDEENVASKRIAERLGMLRNETVTAHGRPHAVFVADAYASASGKPAV